MWWKGGRFNGMFTYRGRMYSLKNMGGEVHAVVETDPGKMPPDHGSMPRARPQSADVKDDPLVARGEGAMMRPRDRAKLKDRQDSIGTERQPKTGRQSLMGPAHRDRAAAARQAARHGWQRRSTIDVMVLYTSKVASKYIDVEQGPDRACRSSRRTSRSQTAGLPNIKLRLVHEQPIDYDESDGEHFNHLYRMVDAEGVFAKVRALRNEKRADVVALIVDDASGCGLSTRVRAEADEAFVVVHHSCAALTLFARARGRPHHRRPPRPSAGQECRRRFPMATASSTGRNGGTS